MIKVVMIIPIMIDDQNCNDHAHYKGWSILKWSCTLKTMIKIVMFMHIIDDDQNWNDHTHYNRWSKL